jgi:hypothetical protein
MLQQGHLRAAAIFKRRLLPRAHAGRLVAEQHSCSTISKSAAILPASSRRGAPDNAIFCFPLLQRGLRQRTLGRLLQLQLITFLLILCLHIFIFIIITMLLLEFLGFLVLHGLRLLLLLTTAWRLLHSIRLALVLLPLLLELFAQAGVLVDVALEAWL